MSIPFNPQKAFRRGANTQTEQSTLQRRPQPAPSRALAMESVRRESISAVVIDRSHSKAKKYLCIWFGDANAWMRGALASDLMESVPQKWIAEHDGPLTYFLLRDPLQIPW